MASSKRKFDSIESTTTSEAGAAVDEATALRSLLAGCGAPEDVVRHAQAHARACHSLDDLVVLRHWNRVGTQTRKTKTFFFFFLFSNDRLQRMWRQRWHELKRVKQMRDWTQR